MSDSVSVNQLAHRDYLDLPESIRALYSFDQYLWLSDAEKARLIQAETEPDSYSD
jgi:hypothetical protein